MARSWRILQSAVEQEIWFPSKDVFEKYIDHLEEENEPYQILNEKMDPSGYIVIMRKRYNFTPFMEVKLPEKIHTEIFANQYVIEEGLEI